MKTRIVIIVLCSLLMALPIAAMPFFQWDDDPALAEFPSLRLEEGGLNRAFGQEFEQWLCDHFAFRKAVLRADALLNERLLRTSPNEDVIVGRDGWLYYAETVGDFTGEAPLTDEELAAMVECLTAMADAVAERGGRLYLAVVPNKSTVYPAHMPARYAWRGGSGNIERLHEAAAGLELTWIDLQTPLAEAAGRDALVYYRTDTHWNALGAAVAADAILQAAGRGGVAALPTGEEIFDQGDLARLMSLDGVLRETAPVVKREGTAFEADFAEFSLRAAGRGEGSLLFLRDSFGTAVAPWIVDAWAETELLWQSPLELIAGSDDVLILIAERNLRRYLSEPPILYEDEAPDDAEAVAMDAPAPDADGEADIADAGDGEPVDEEDEDFVDAGDWEPVDEEDEDFVDAEDWEPVDEEGEDFIDADGWELVGDDEDA